MIAGVRNCDCRGSEDSFGSGMVVVCIARLSTTSKGVYSIRSLARGAGGSRKRWLSLLCCTPALV